MVILLLLFFFLSFYYMYSFCVREAAALCCGTTHREASGAKIPSSSSGREWVEIRISSALVRYFGVCSLFILSSFLFFFMFICGEAAD